MRALALLLAAAASLVPAGAAADDDPWFGPDKVKHFGASAALAVGGYALGAAFFDEVPARLATGAGIALGAGVAKEVADLAGAGSASWRDLVWDVAGTGAGLLVAWGVDAVFFAPAGGADDARLVTLQGRF
ncbi:YfiM family protein [Vulgatibacter sp.]|uniref:YfiM family protein n=1 Tax=Vulgatibacter sp. TaxID=1971226 RepID=UPI003567CF7B